MQINFGRLMDLGYERYLGIQNGNKYYIIYVDGNGTMLNFRNPFYYSLVGYIDKKGNNHCHVFSGITDPLLQSILFFCSALIGIIATESICNGLLIAILSSLTVGSITYILSRMSSKYKISKTNLLQFIEKQLTANNS